MGVYGSRLDGLVAKEQLDLVDVHPGFVQVGCVSVAKAVQGDRLADTRGLPGAPEYLLQTARTVGFAGPGGVALPAFKQVFLRTVGFVVRPQLVKDAPGQRYIPVFIALAVPNMDEHAPAVDVPELQPQQLTAAQPGRIY